MLAQYQYGADPPANCGEPYKDLTNPPGGWDVDSPTAWKPWASSEDVDVWNDQARYAFAMVRTAWNTLMALEDDRRDWTETTSLTKYVTEYEREYSELQPSSWYQIAGMSGAVSAAIRSTQTAACALHQLNLAIERARTSPDQPGPVPTPHAPINPIVPEGFVEGLGQGAMGLGMMALAGLAVFALMSSGQAAPRRKKR